MIDLHTHSTMSDGSDTPETVVELAHEAGCAALALTDHDTVAGIPEAAGRARALGLTFVPGCELTCLPIGRGGVHVLVYFVGDHDPDTLEESPLGRQLGELQDDRRYRNEALVVRLAELGVPVTWEALVAEAGTEVGIGRPHVAAAMVKAGWVTSAQEAFERYLGNDAPAYIPHGRLTVTDVIDLARASGAVTSLAHPHTLGLEDSELPATLERLAAAGLVGLEVTYGRYSARQRQEMGHLAQRFGLVPTGGSDYHGTATPDLAVGTGTGDLKVPDKVLAQLVAART